MEKKFLKILLLICVTLVLSTCSSGDSSNNTTQDCTWDVSNWNDCNWK